MTNETTSEGPSDSPSADSEPLKASPERSPITKPKDTLSESLRAALSALPDDALSILGPELFDQANNELNRYPQTRADNERSGMTCNAIDGYMRFFYRDEKGRARHMYHDIVGLCYPCSKSEAEKRRLKLVFEDGWDSGELRFLARVPREDLDLYRGALSGPE